MARPDSGNPLRTGIFGIVLVACLVLVSFGYTSLPFWPQGKPFEAYFTDAGGISPGNDVNVSGINVGKVTGVALAGDTAKVTFTVNRDVKVGDQSLVAIKTDTVLGEKSLAVTPRGGGQSTVIPLGRTTTPYTLNTALQDLGQNVGELDKPRFEQALQTLTDSLGTRPRSCAVRSTVSPPVAQHQQTRRGAGTASRTRQEGVRHAGRSGRAR